MFSPYNILSSKSEIVANQNLKKGFSDTVKETLHTLSINMLTEF